MTSAGTARTWWWFYICLIVCADGWMDGRIDRWWGERETTIIMQQQPVSVLLTMHVHNVELCTKLYLLQLPFVLLFYSDNSTALVCACAVQPGHRQRQATGKTLNWGERRGTSSRLMFSSCEQHKRIRRNFTSLRQFINLTHLRHLVFLTNKT